ncbi:MAG TPA: integrase core domain-containing protein [Rhodothermales bacterium]|nr:integrase core domain-containing protein [Rhodothermales bacterium]
MGDRHMEEQHYAARAKLRELQAQYPHWTHGRMAEELGYSVGWVRKWRRRLRQAAPDDESVLRGLSRRRKTPYPRPDPRIVQRVLEMRDHPPENLCRIPGPKALLHYLSIDKELKTLGLAPPRSTRTIWRILDEHGRITRPAPIEHEPLERPEPMTSWAMDFKDITSIPPEPDGKQQHAVEVLNVVDEGTSFWLDYQIRGDFAAETTVYALALSFQKLGIPEQLRLDRDPRLVGPAGMRDFPSAVQRFLLCLGITPILCPPHRPDKNPYVERLHGTLERECIQVNLPKDIPQAAEVFEHFHYHYHHERPHQGSACDNQPPATAFPNLPALPALPDWVDPDRWLWHIKGKRFVRKVRANGSMTIDKTSYYVSKALAGQYIVVWVDAAHRELVVLHRHKETKRMPIKGLHESLMSLEDYLPWIAEQARSEQRRLRYAKQRVLR